MTILPTQKTPKKTDLSDLTVLLYGKSKIGKSQLCSQAEDALFIATEPGLNHLDVYQVPITKWDDFLAVCKEIASGNHSFKTIVIDTIDNLYRLCVDFICQKHKIEHESDFSYGKGYALVKAEFQRVLTKLAFQPYGLFFVSHAQTREFETRTGTHARTVPTLPDKAREFILGLVDLVLFCDIETKKDAQGKVTHTRVMKTKPHPDYEAGDRTGKLPEELPLNFEAFAKAFQAARK